MDITAVTRSVAETVRTRIETAGETQLAIAESTGIPRTTLMRRLSGVSPFTIAELAAIAEALDCPLTDLVTPASTATKLNAGAA